jgi:hypothetical protein
MPLTPSQRQKVALANALNSLDGVFNIGLSVEKLGKDIQIQWMADVLSSSAMPDPQILHNQVETLDELLVKFRDAWSEYTHNLAIAQAIGDGRIK